MTIYNLGETGVRRLTVSTSICVIGAGMAGLLLARRLARAGLHVTLVESGRAFFDPDIQDLNEIEDLNGIYKWAVTGRARGLGGTSARWGGRIISLSQQEADFRTNYSLPGWPFPMSELDAYRPEVERLLRLDHSSFEEDVLDDLDRKRLFLRNDPDLTCRWIKWATFKRGNLTTLLKSELQSLRSLDVWLNATVCGFDYDAESGRLLGIRARSLEGHELEVRAKEFVFSAGTIETTRLLLLLDDISEKRAFRRCCVLGRYFQDHLDARVGQLRPRDRTATNLLFAPRLLNSVRRSPHLELNSNITGVGSTTGASFAHVTFKLAENRALSTVKSMYDSIRVMKFGVKLADLAEIARNYKLLSEVAFWRLVRRQFFIPDDVEYKLHICIEQAPDLQNRISLSEKRDRLGVPMVSLNWRATDADERTFRSSIAKINAYWRRSGFDQICPIEWTFAAKDTSVRIVDEAEDWCHPSGTTRMGLDPAESVVGSDMSCHDIPNVRVVSASTFPTSGSVNPTLTIMQLALRCADLILQRSATDSSYRVLPVAPASLMAKGTFSLEIGERLSFVRSRETARQDVAPSRTVQHLASRLRLTEESIKDAP